MVEISAIKLGAALSSELQCENTNLASPNSEPLILPAFSPEPIFLSLPLLQPPNFYLFEPIKDKVPLLRLIYSSTNLTIVIFARNSEPLEDAENESSMADSAIKRGAPSTNKAGPPEKRHRATIDGISD